MWLDFLQTFTAYPEGQASMAKATDVLELVMSLTFNAKSRNQLMAVLVLRNIAFYQPNRLRLLSSGKVNCFFFFICYKYIYTTIFR